jgi:hypothetical protein
MRLVASSFQNVSAIVIVGTQQMDTKLLFLVRLDPLTVSCLQLGPGGGGASYLWLF